MLSTSPGISLPSLARVAEYHPQWALAAAMGVPVRPDVRILSVNFPATAAVGQGLPSSFSQPITKNSIFVGCELTVDPTSAFPGNILKGLNDATMALVTAVTFTLLTTGPRGNYTPVFDDVPLQLIPSLLKPFSGMWGMQGPSENVKARFTLQSAPNGGVPFTAWLGMSFAVLEGDCGEAYAMSKKDARAALKDLGICCGSG